MSIVIDPNDNQYDMGFLRLLDEKIISNEFTYTIGGGNETASSTDSGDPYKYKGSKNEYSWDASEVPMEYHDLLIRAKIEKTTFPITVFNHGPLGEYNHKGTLKYARIDEVSVKNGDEGMSLDVSGIALGFELPK